MEYSDENFDFLIKIVLIGNSGVGKTKLLTRFKSNTFTPDSKNTIGVDFYAKDMSLKNKNIKI